MNHLFSVEYAYEMLKQQESSEILDSKYNDTIRHDTISVNNGESKKGDTIERSKTNDQKKPAKQIF